MSTDKRKAAATATLGYAGVAGAGALRHTALDARYGKEKRPRFPVGHELGFLRRGARGRKRWLAGAALGLAAVPAASKGTNDLLRKADDRKHKSFLAEGVEGTREAWRQRSDNLASKPPPKLVAGNYALGAAIGSGAGALTHLGLGRTKVGGAARSALAASAALGVGSASIPAQSRVIQRATHGQYEATPNGVRRRKRAPVKPSRYAERQPAGSPVAKVDDPGARMSRGERRARVTASGPPIPVVGDIAQARTAARLSPAPYRRRSAAQNYTAGAAGGAAGNVVGGVGAAYLASRSPGFSRRATAANDRVEGAKASVRSKVGLKAPSGPSLGAKAAQRAGERSPRLKALAGAVARSGVGRTVASHKGPAAIGALVGGAIAGQAAQQSMYGHIMTRDDRYRRAHNPQGRHGSRVSKDAVSGMSRREEVANIKRKQRAAAANAALSTASIGATGLLGGSLLPKIRHTPRAGKLRTASFATGTVAGGLAALNGIEGSRLQRRDLAARRRVLESKGGVTKALTIPRPRLVPTGARRAPAMRRGFIRQTRYPSGITRVSTVRGGLG